MIKSLPVMQDTWVQSLCQEDPLEKEMATHSSILAWRIPWTMRPGRLQSTGSQRVGHDRVTNTFTFREAVAHIDGNRGSGSDCWGLDTGPCTNRVTTGESFILLAY